MQRPALQIDGDALADAAGREQPVASNGLEAQAAIPLQQTPGT